MKILHVIAGSIFVYSGVLMQDVAPAAALNFAFAAFNFGIVLMQDKPDSEDSKS